MWCDHCQRDVPILRQPDGGLLCPQCGTYRRSADSTLAKGRDEAPRVSACELGTDSGDTSATGPMPESPTSHGLDSFSISSQDAWWELEARLRELRLALDGVMPLDAAEDREAVRTSRHDLAHQEVSAVHWSRPERRRPARVPVDQRDRAESSVVFWGALALGLTCFVCGSILLGWSLVLKATVLGFYGVPIGSVGLGFLLVAALFRPRNTATRKLHPMPRQRRTASRLRRKSGGLQYF